MIFTDKDHISIILGSSNLTGGGLGNNIEANIFITSDKPGNGSINKIDEYFDTIWTMKPTGGPKILTEHAYRLYAHNWNM